MAAADYRHDDQQVDVRIGTVIAARHGAVEHDTTGIASLNDSVGDSRRPRDERSTVVQHLAIDQLDARPLHARSLHVGVVAAGRRDDTIGYLRGREQTTNVYREVMRSVWLENEARQRVSALAYVVDRGHVQYAGRLSLAEQLRYVQQGHGRSGNNRDYVLSTVKSIEAQGFRDPQLHQLALMLHDDVRSLHPPPG